MLSSSLHTFIKKEGKSGLKARLSDLLVVLKRHKRKTIFNLMLSSGLFIVSFVFMLINFIDLETVLLMKLKIFADAYFVINLIVVGISAIFSFVNFRKLLRIRTAIKFTEEFIRKLDKIENEDDLIIKTKTWIKKLSYELGTPKIVLNMTIFNKRNNNITLLAL